MSVQAMAWVLEHSRAERPATRLVALALANYAREDGSNAYPAIAKVARDARVSGRTAQRALRELVKMGELVEEGASGYGTRVYRFAGMQQGSLFSADGRARPTVKMAGFGPQGVALKSVRGELPAKKTSVRQVNAGPNGKGARGGGDKLSPRQIRHVTPVKMSPNPSLKSSVKNNPPVVPPQAGERAAWFKRETRSERRQRERAEWKRARAEEVRARAEAQQRWEEFLNRLKPTHEGMSAANVWDGVLSEMKKAVNPHSFEIWFRNTRGVGFSLNGARKLVVVGPNRLFVKRLTETYGELVGKNLPQGIVVEYVESGRSECEAKLR